MFIVCIYNVILTDQAAKLKINIQFITLLFYRSSKTEHLSLNYKVSCIISKPREVQTGYMWCK